MDAPYADILPISALQHLIFCERQCALIHIERLWAENRLTVEGQHLHRKAHDGSDTTRRGVKTARGMELVCQRLGLFGKADVVEFHPVGNGRTVPFPIEYKRGKPKSNDCDRVQLGAQALCLEEMIGVSVPAGAIFYGRTRRRIDVMIDPSLRRRVEEAAHRLHELIESGETPIAPREPKCDQCSLLNLCLPHANRPRRTASSYLSHAIAAVAET
ncbi:MAG TPA: CRISPR-associated protein Cas4 [Phycisphaerales bacterium]|nr:CRISPR-associated protein Cas4 [Phycisphaerales bacterium]HRQ76827.1 CRISPR-associated protein Cas4 [Phycisphaerales bacterium]